MIETEAWVLYRGDPRVRARAELRRETFFFDDITDEEVLAEPLYGCWEANIEHALKRFPVDVCRLRCEEKVVLGNAGVVRILKAGSSVRHLREGDLCVLVPVGQLDPYGYILRVFAYDAPETVGMLAKRVKLHARQAALLPAGTRHSLPQWAASSVRYATAWDNWKVAYGCWRLQMSEEDSPAPHVWGWGGGVALAELSLAKHFGCRVAMISSKEARLRQIAAMGITPVDRRRFPDLDYDEQRHLEDESYRARYQASERTFLSAVREVAGPERVSIFIDNIGTPVLRATLKALGRQGVITTAGWDGGGAEKFSRINECINRHIHVHTHGARYSEAVAAIGFAEEHGWMPPAEQTVYGWDDIPRLAHDFASGEIDSYFPIFEVNRP